MAKLDVDAGSTFIGKKIVELHDKNEYTRIDKWKEGLCWSCFSRKPVGATLVDCCQKCYDRKGQEAILVTAGMKPYGMCYLDGEYTGPIYQVNARFCMTCAKRYRARLTKYNLDGGPMGSDPFWKSMRRKFGKDYAILMSSGDGRANR